MATSVLLTSADEVCNPSVAKFRRLVVGLGYVSLGYTRIGTVSLEYLGFENTGVVKLKCNDLGP